MDKEMVRNQIKGIWNTTDHGSARKRAYRYVREKHFRNSQFNLHKKWKEVWYKE